MRISDFEYSLPPEKIAVYPPVNRGTAKLMVLDKQTGTIRHDSYQHVIDYLSPGDIIVLNNTKVMPARLLGINQKGKQTEFIILENHGDQPHRKVFRALVKGSCQEGNTIKINDYFVTVKAKDDQGVVTLESNTDVETLLNIAGLTPIPPYLKRQAEAIDIERYQTTFALNPGSVAAPTASLNMTAEILAKLKEKGVKIVYVTLHVGLGTFLPVRTDDVQDHVMHSEYYEIPAKTITTIREAKSQDKKILAVGTTVTRTLEHAADKILTQSQLTQIRNEADIFIYPGYTFKVVDKLLTNFHAPRSTVLLLAAAFAGQKNLLTAYQEALVHDYKFLSYGDSMLII